jgi:hypothetical protein
MCLTTPVGRIQTERQCRAMMAHQVVERERNGSTGSPRRSPGQYVCDRLPPLDPDNYARVIVDLVIAGLKGGALNGVRLFEEGCTKPSGTRPSTRRKRR